MHMSSIWLVFAENDLYARVCEEISARCPAPRFMRLNEAVGSVDVARVLASSAAGAAIALDDGDETAALLRGLAESGWNAPILVWVRTVDPCSIAALFDAGATEIMTTDGAVGALDIEAACDEEELCVRGAPASVELKGDGVGEGLEEPDSLAPDSDEVDWDEIPPWQVERWASDATPYECAVATRQPLGACDGGGAAASQQQPVMPTTSAGPRAPLVAVLSGHGGVGKTTLTASFAYAAASMGLRAAVLDLDLMFGNMYDMLGVDEPRDMAQLIDGEACGLSAAERVEATAMQLAPGVTLWGPCFQPECAEVLSHPVEELISLLRIEADVLFVDTSTHWGDAVAMAVAQCDRCLVVGQAGSAPSCVRAIDLAARVGVAKTKMTAVFNRFGAAGNQEEQALRFEMAVALSSRVRVPDGASELHQMAAFGRLGEYMASSSHYASEVSRCAAHLLKELGCDISAWERAQQVDKGDRVTRRKMAPPWRLRRGEER